MTVQITIVGLGQIGASIGLALKARNLDVRIVGHDKDPETARDAQKMGAVDEVKYNLPASVRDSRIVILALPFAGMRETLEAIGPDLPEGSLVIDTAPSKTTVTAWAKEFLPQGRYYVGLTPAINPAYLHGTEFGVKAARADLFDKGLVAVNAPLGTPEGVFNLSMELVALFGATPLLMDTAEADGVFSAMHILPQLAAAALLTLLPAAVLLLLVRLASPLLLFLLSAQLEEGVSARAEDALSSEGSLLSGSTVLVLGSDARLGESIDESQTGPARADTIMLVRLDADKEATAILSLPRDLRVEHVPDPRIVNPRDAIVRVTTTAICGSDLHLYNGYIPTMRAGDILGHEFMGEVVEVGPGVRNLRAGDRVVVPFPIADGTCFFCRHGMPTACENSNPKHYGPEGGVLRQKGGGLFGYSDLYGGYAGGQAEYVRVPYAMANRTPVPGDLTDEQLLMCPDIMSTGFGGAENGGIRVGDTVAIFAQGPIGLCAHGRRPAPGRRADHSLEALVEPERGVNLR